MPNIEIHGLGVAEKDGMLVNEAWEMRKIIFVLFKDSAFIDKMVVVVIESHVTDQTGKEQPFLRLLSSEEDHVQEILEKLQTLGIDIEYKNSKNLSRKKYRTQNARSR